MRYISPEEVAGMSCPDKTFVWIAKMYSKQYEMLFSRVLNLVHVSNLPVCSTIGEAYTPNSLDYDRKQELFYGIKTIETTVSSDVILQTLDALLDDEQPVFLGILAPYHPSVPKHYSGNNGDIPLLLLEKKRDSDEYTGVDYFHPLSLFQIKSKDLYRAIQHNKTVVSYSSIRNHIIPEPNMWKQEAMNDLPSAIYIEHLGEINDYIRYHLCINKELQITEDSLVIFLKLFKDLYRGFSLYPRVLSAVMAQFKQIPHMYQPIVNELSNLENYVLQLHNFIQRAIQKENYAINEQISSHFCVLIEKLPFLFVQITDLLGELQ